MRKAIDETNRRREIQEKYNLENGIIPKTIVKPIREPIHLIENINEAGEYKNKTQKLSKKAKEKLLLDIEKEMRDAAKRLDFERAAELRDILIELREED
jgi:excinuclease ABC subunit B